MRGDSYTVHYAKFWWNFTLRDWCEPDRVSDRDTFTSLINHGRVKLFNFEEAKELADSLTVEKCITHERDLDNAYRAAVDKVTKQRDARKAREYSR